MSIAPLADKRQRTGSTNIRPNNIYQYKTQPIYKNRFLCCG